MTQKQRTGWLWFTVLLLALSVAASTVAITGRLNNYLLDDSGAIPLIPDDSLARLEAAAAHATFEQPPVPQLKAELTPAKASSGKTSSFFEVVDEKVTWSTMTPVDIFSITYANGEQNITVKTDDGDKLIAPGTEQSYTFKLKNTGTTPLNYLLNVDAYVTPGDVRIPVESRINRYDGEWIVGDKEQYVDVATLDTAEDSAPLGAGKYTYYTLDWRWPFESGDDEYDTLLGNMAVDQDLTLTIIISTTAVADEEPTDPDDPDNPDRPGVDPEDPDKPRPSQPDGITPPDTGDISQLGLWMMIAVASFSLMMALITYLLKKKQPLTEAENIEKDKI